MEFLWGIYGGTIAFYSTENFNVSNKVQLALETTLASDMYQYDFVYGDITKKRTWWAILAYSYFIEEKNEILIGLNPLKLEEFPIQEWILSELVVYWTQYYSANTIRVLITALHKSHIERGYEKFESNTFKKLHAAYTIAQKQKVIMCRLKMNSYMV